MFFYDKLFQTIELSSKDTFTKEEILTLIKAKSKITIDAEIESNGVTLLPNMFVIKQGDKVDVVPRKIFRLLYFLILNKNKIITRNDIICSCWEDDVVVIEKTVDVHICNLKKILIDASPLKTRKTLGYIWIEK